jgi:hypothetical protein
MIGLTDLAVKEMLETRFRMPSIWTSETVAIMSRGDERFQKFPSLVEKRLKDGKEIIFPFCAFIRTQGQAVDDRFNLAMALSGYKSGIEFRDRTRTYKVRMIPILYPYLIQYYCDQYDQTILLEKKYWGLKLEPMLPLKFPLDSSPDQSFNTNAEIQLEGFEVASRDQEYERGRFYTGAMGFNVLTYIAEGYEVPLIQKVEVGIYDKDLDHYLEKFAKDQKFWRS